MKRIVTPLPVRSPGLPRLALACLLLLSARSGALAQIWDREVAPGIVFRMERQAEPQRNIYGLKIDPRRVRSESSLAQKTIYAPGPNNGRSTLSTMVEGSAAIGGVNGDFFQWGKDPGGDPMNLMVHGGELLSHPGSGNRGFAAGWGPDAVLQLGSATWEATFTVNGGAPQTINSLNARADAGQVTLHTDSAGYVYAGAEVKQAVMARVRAGAYRLGTGGSLAGRVVEVVPLQGRVRIAPGEFLLTGAGRAAEVVRGLKPGDTIQTQVRVAGFDWGRVDEVIGGGPLLLQDGKNLLPADPNEFNDTRHPRTALGRTPDGNLWFVAVDGRQTMSVGAQLTELTEIMRRWGCVDAINLDGGGSTTLNIFGLTLNRPSGGVERAIGNGILFYGTRPTPAEKAQVSLRTPQEPLTVGKAVRIEALRNGNPVPVNRTLFTAQGAGWIDQEGMLHPIKGGPVEITVLADGVTAHARLNVAGDPKAAPQAGEAHQ